jgi:hypothetical protein
MIMPGIFRRTVLLVGAFSSLAALAQKQAVKADPATIDVAVTYVAERAKIASTPCGCFWLEGGGMDVAVTFYRGLGVAGSLTGGHASSVQPGVDLDKVYFMMGPRYTYQPKSWFGHNHDGLSIFGQGLIGGVHAFNTVVPSSNGSLGASSSFGFQVGGGVNWLVRKNIGIRLAEAEFVRSTLPNGGNDSQHDLRLAAGVTFRFTN